MDSQTSSVQARCTTPAAMGFWSIVFIAALALLIVIAVYWHPFSGAVAPFAAGIACVANWRRNRTYHCRISGPIFFFAGAILFVAGMSLIRVQPLSVWMLAGAGVLVSFFLEWGYAGRRRRTTK